MSAQDPRARYNFPIQMEGKNVHGMSDVSKSLDSGSMDTSERKHNGQAVSASFAKMDAGQLRSRLYSHGPQQVPPNPRALQFNRVTKAQLNKAMKTNVPKLEPLVSFTRIKCR